MDKIADGNAGHRPAKVLGFEGRGRPVCPAYLREKADKSGAYPSAAEIFESVCDWLEGTGTVHLIPPEYLIDYAMLKVRWLEAEARTDVVGFLGKHPVNQTPITSPYIKSGIEYLKQANAAWDKIWCIVAQNSEKEFRFDAPNDSDMAAILKYGAAKRPSKPRKPKKEETDVRGDGAAESAAEPDEPGEI